MKNRILYIVITFLCCSCSPSLHYISLDIRKPATVTLPLSFERVLVVDNSPLFDDNINTARTEETLEQILLMADSAKYVVLSSLVEYMNAEEFFKKVELYPLRMNNTKNGEGINYLTSEDVIWLCNRNRVDGVISFDILAMKAYFYLEEPRFAFEDGKMPYCVKFQAIVTLYTKSGERIQLPMLIDSDGEDLSSKVWNSMKNNTYQAKDFFSERLRIWSDELTADFTPLWVKNERFIYIGKTEEMQKAATLFKKGEYQQAASIWSSLFEKTEKRKEKVQLAINIAMTNEFLEDLSYAYEWINIAGNLLKKNESSDMAYKVEWYRAQLKGRISNMPKLNEQLGHEYIDGVY